MSHALFILFRNRRDGWCAAPPGFRNFLRDPIGHGQSRVEAISNLLAHPEFIRRAQMGDWPLRPSLGAFVEAPEADGFVVQEPSLVRNF
jgi:hypothetical protein